MKQRYNKLSHSLCERAVFSCFDGKWHRPEILAFISHYAGISPKELCAAELNQSMNVKLEAVDAIVYFLEEVMEELMDGEPLDMRGVIVRQRPDGMTGKIRSICDLCILHQLLGHLVKLGLEPLLKARILPNQFASIPDRGQTGLLKKAEKYIRNHSLEIAVCQKTAVEKGYGTLMYNVIIDMIEKEIPSAKWIIVLLKALSEYAPGGHLIIGGYLDAWLFNYAMSFALRFVQTCGKTRRGKFIAHVKKDVSYMDDFGLFGKSESSLRKTVKILNSWMQENLGVKLKIKENMIHFMSYAEERKRKKAKNRGCPCLDMGGYKIHRGYTTIRPGIFKRTRREFTRGWEEIQRFGTFHLQRAKKIMAYNGYLDWTDSKMVIKKYHVKEVVEMAKHVISYWSRRSSIEKQKRKVHYVMQSPVRRKARKGCAYCTA